MPELTEAEIIRLEGVLSDPFGEENPFALNQRFEPLAYTDPTEWKREVARLTPSGIIVEAYSADRLKVIYQTVVATEPLIAHFGLVAPTHVMDIRWDDNPTNWGSGTGEVCNARCLSFKSNLGHMQVSVISLVGDNNEVGLLWDFIHELSHLEKSPYEADHGVHFWLRYGAYLAWYFQQDASPLKEELAEIMESVFDAEDVTPYLPDEFYFSANEYAQQIANSNWCACVSHMLDEHRQELEGGV